MNMNEVVFHVATTLLNESMSSLNFSGKKLHQFFKYAQHKTFCFCMDVYKFSYDEYFDKMFEA